MKQRLMRRRKKFVPLHKGSLRPSGVEFVRTVTHSNDARLAAGAGPRISWTVAINEHDALTPPREMPRRPRAKHSRADDCHVE